MKGDIIPPQGGSGVTCDHLYQFMESDCTIKDAGYSTTYIRIDRFFCQKCLKIEERSQAVSQREAPPWWRPNK